MLKKIFIQTKKRLSITLVAGVLLILVGVGFMLYPWMSDWRYASYQNNLRAHAAFKVADKKRPKPVKKVASRPLPGSAIANIVIPKIKLDAFVLHGTDQDTLSKGPGHYEETPLPGEDGNVAIAGHRTLYGHPFRYLDQLAAGDEIIIYVKDRKLVYRVVEQRYVSPKEVSVAAPTKDNRLTLTTCAPVGSAAQRLVIIAKQVKK